MLRSFTIVSAIALSAWAQTAPPPAFEVAAIKLSASGQRRANQHTSQGEVLMKNYSLKQYVEMAYDARDFSFSGPDWLETVRFDITAKPPAVWSSKDQFGPMLQNLLAERFKLVVHRESKVMPAFALVQAKGGIKLKPVANPDGGNSSNNNGKYVASPVTMREFADFLSRQLNSPVVDKTEAPGSFNFTLEFSVDEVRPGEVKPGNDRPPDNAAPSIYTALPEQLGLRLVSQKLPVEVVVVDHMERVPTEN
jgi:uncharacterized protein (TIGR03435 family)